MCCSTSSRLLGWGVSVRTGSLSRARLCVLLAGGGLGGRGAEQLGDGSLLFAGFPFDVLAQGVCLGLDVGLGRHGLDVGLDGLTDSVGQRDFSELCHDGQPGVQVVIEADGQRLHDTSSPDSSCRSGQATSSGWRSR